VELVPQRQYQGTPEELLAVMDRKSIRSMVNLIGGALVSPDSRNCSFIIPNAQHNLTIRPEDKGPFFWWKTAPGVFVPVLFPPPFATVREPGSSANDFEYAMSLPFLSDEGLEVY
jgi:hypothetical protein